MNVSGELPLPFQSAPPARGAISFASAIHQSIIVSIRAPRAGGDCRTHKKKSVGYLFQSAPPARGAMLAIVHGALVAVKFQSAPPARGAMR